MMNQLEKKYRISLEKKIEKKLEKAGKNLSKEIKKKVEVHRTHTKKVD
jgi:hypothetical protein